MSSLCGSLENIDFSDLIEMKASLLSSFRTDEESFMKSEFDDLNSYLDQRTSIGDQLINLSNSESGEENYERTLSDWERHVGSVPMMDSNGYSDNGRILNCNLDLLEYSPEISTLVKSRENLNSTKLENEIAMQIHSDINYNILAEGDNRLIDNDNTSGYNVIPDVESNSTLLDGIDGRLLEFDTLNNLFDSIKSSELNSEIIYLPDINHSTENIELTKVLSTENVVGKSSPLYHIQKKYAFTTKTKRKKQQSFSLPQSPEHDAFGIYNIDMQSSFSFEDIDGVDINSFVDSDININPEKVFNKSFDLSDVLNDTKNDMLKKNIDESDDFFINSEALNSSTKDFDLASFIMGKSDSNNLVDSLQTDIQNSENINYPNDKIIENVSKTPQPKINKNKSLEAVARKKSKRLTKSAKITLKMNEPIIPRDTKTDTDDYVDVESVSDDESISLFAANILSAPTNQLEVSECNSKSMENVSKTTVPKKLLNNNNTTKKSRSITTKYLKTNPQEPIISKSHSVSKENNKVPVKSKQEFVNLDHDYCKTFTGMEPAYKNSSKPIEISQKCGSEDNNETVDLSSYSFHSLIPDLKMKDTLTLMKFPKANVPKLQKKVEICSQKSVNIEKLKTNSPSKACSKTLTTIKCEVPAKSREDLKKETSNVKNVIMMDDDCNRLIDMNQNSGNILTVNNTFNCDFEKNSLVITNLVKSQSGDKPLHKNVTNKKINICKSNLNRQEYNLLKPFLKDNVKMVSLLKSNYSDKNFNLKNQTNPEIKKIDIKSSPIKINVIQQNNLNKEKIVDIKGVQNINSQKRRLNIEQYKKLRESSNFYDNSRTSSPICVVDNGMTLNFSKITTNSEINGNFKSINVCEMPTGSTSTNTNSKLFDPIADATRKALKMKKKALQISKEDKIIKSKIANVDNFVILPLETENGKLLPMIKTKTEGEAESGRSLPMIITAENEAENITTEPILPNEINEYTKIVTVSVGINTDMNVNRKMGISKKGDQQNLIASVNDYLRVDETIKYLTKDTIKPEMQTAFTQTDPEVISIITKTSSSESPAIEQCERHDSSMSISDESNCDKNRIDLIKRWKDDVKKSDLNHVSYTSSHTASSRGSRVHKRISNYRKRHESQSSDSSQSSSRNKERSSSCSGSRKKNHGPKNTSKYHSTDTKNGSAGSLLMKRKRNVSTSSDDHKQKLSRDFKEFQPPSKIVKDYNSDESEVRTNDKAKSKSRSYSSSSCSSCSSSQSSSNSDSSDSSRSSSVASYRSASPKYKSRCRSKSRNRSRSRSRSSESSRYRRRKNTARNMRRNNELCEERKIIYVGMLESNITTSALKMKFLKYGCVEEVTIHSKDDGMRYGFVTFAQAQQSYKAIESAPQDPDIKHYDVFFGARRAFCKQYYADLDDLGTIEDDLDFYPAAVKRSLAPKPKKSFELLLQEAKDALFARKARNQGDSSDKIRQKS